MLPEDFPEPAGSAPQGSAPRQRYWLHALLFALTIVSTCIIGSRMQADFRQNLPFLGGEGVFDAFAQAWRHPATIADGLPFSLTLLTILMAHEMGHYVACLYYRLDATLPFFLPAPVLIGTFGAFIRIRSPIYSKRALFDVAVAGPIAGFLVAVPALAAGLAFSKVISGIVPEGGIRFGTPLLLWFLQHAIFPGVAPADIYLHPVARAGWIGLLATAWNLLPLGQLDGGHVVYSFAARWHKRITYSGLALLLPMGRFWLGWPIWAVLLFVFARKHPAIFDDHPLGPSRGRLGWLVLAIFLLSFTVTPFDEP